MLITIGLRLITRAVFPVGGVVFRDSASFLARLELIVALSFSLDSWWSILTLGWNELGDELSCAV